MSARDVVRALDRQGEAAVYAAALAVALKSLSCQAARSFAVSEVHAYREWRCVDVAPVAPEKGST